MTEVGDVDGSIARMTKNSGGALPRFLVPDLDPSSGRARLPRDEAHHLSRVLRLGAGDRVAVFDGRGREWIAEIDDARGDAATVTLVEPGTPPPEPAVPFDVVQALLKGSAMDEVVRDATMMGARRIVPVITDHVASRLTMRSGAVERWRRLAVASAKQCRRAVVPDIAPVRLLPDWMAGREGALRLMFVEPAAGTRAVRLRRFIGSPAPTDAALVVGPEGGWSRNEVELGERSGCALVTLGAITLRADATCVAAAAAFRLIWED